MNKVIRYEEGSYFNGGDTLIMRPPPGDTEPAWRVVVDTRQPIRQGGEAELLQWWISLAVDDFYATVPKMLEYGGKIGSEGAADLRTMGDALATLLGWGIFTPVALELACWFYVLGKVGRLISDYQNQRPGKRDTWFDIVVYSMMARRIQETGRWP